MAAEPSVAYIEITERVRFKWQRPVSWERSFDGGINWETVPWPLKALPFVRLDGRATEDFETITTMRRRVEEEQS